MTIYFVNPRNGERTPVSTGQGSFLEWIEWEGETYWKYGEPYEKWEVLESTLDSDSSKRPDSIALRANDYKTAQKEKEKLE